jgi:signal transduction histidine kinase
LNYTHLQEDFIPIYAQIGFAYKDGGMPDSALVYVRRGYQSALKGLSIANPKEYYRDFGEIYYKKGNNDSAMYYFRRSIIALGNNPNGQTYIGIARIMRDKNQIDSAKVYAKGALKIFQKNNYNYFIIDCAQLLFDMYKDTDAIEAQKYRLIVLETKDKLYDQDKAKQVEKLAFEELEREMEIQMRLKDIKNRNRFYALLGILGGILLLSFILYRNNRQKQKANKILENTLTDLKTTQAQLIQSEKLASLGELTAGIAHEIQNPLNFVNNFAEVSAEMLDELKEGLTKGETNEAQAIADDLKTNLEKINHHGQRASSIVKGMLEHSRGRDAINRVSTDLNALADEYLRLAYHGLRVKDSSFNATIETHFDPDLPKIEVIPQDIGRVLLNLINNAFYAVAERSRSTVAEKAKQSIEGYNPTVAVSSKKLEKGIEISVQDNGNGIPDAIKDKIFQPFFTTKPTGQGTGLGLSLAYDIITKGHGGSIEVKSTEGSGTIFTLRLNLG